MKKTILTTAALAMLALAMLAVGSANAADMAVPPQVYKAAPLPPPPLWTGCYINGGFGYGMWNQDNYIRDSVDGDQLSPNSTAGGRGWLGVAGGGCDYQFTAMNNWNVVIGAFGDYNFMNIHGSLLVPAECLCTGDENESGAWAVGLRAGVLVTPTFLTYINGGYTQARFDQTTLSSFGGGPTFNLAAHTYSGWFLGSGAEYAFTWLPIHGLFLRTEYRFSEYNTADVPISFTDGDPTGVDLHATKFVQTITTSLVWRFNWMGY